MEGLFESVIKTKQIDSMWGIEILVTVYESDKSIMKKLLNLARDAANYYTDI